ncbi:MAG: hypothetical protein K2Q34_07810 [Alphaproteobacteria bacterium]|nr:hypothetical protein [Alphaproteobacteria bacterium]
MIFKNSFSFLLIACFLAGCAVNRENQPINNQIFNRPSTIAIAQLSGLEEPHYYNAGSQGLLDFAVTAMMTDSITKRIQEINAKSIVNEHYYNVFKKSFENKSFGVRIVPYVLDKKDLECFHKNEEIFAPYDLMFLRIKYNAEYALILDPQIFGLKRSYHGFIPVSEPYGYADIKFYIINLTDNTIVGHYNGRSEISVPAEWDTAPEYPELVRAATDALTKVIKDAHRYFFENKANFLIR